MKYSDRVLKKLKALSDKTRLEIVSLLIDKKICVCELSKILKMSQPRISRHLKILTESGILKYEKVAQKVFYYINRKDKTNKSIINLIERELYEERKNKSPVCVCRK
ncbi:MAG: metalloregulator ArsR/SmtB family transcription factor [candidate division WOR-3 bacterium]|jgi:ArsR family transcriptional regulator